MICKQFEAALPMSSGRGGKHRYDPCHPYIALLGIDQVHQGGAGPMTEEMGTTLILAPASQIRVGYHWLNLNLNHLTPASHTLWEKKQALILRMHQQSMCFAASETEAIFLGL